MTKSKNLIEIILVFGVLLLKGLMFNRLPFPWDDNITIVVAYAIDIVIVLFFVVKIDKESISNIGIKAISFVDILGGIILGLVLYLIQILPPIIFMNMDISQFVEQPKWLPLFFRFVFLAVTVGLGEELVFRGFLLIKMEKIIKYKWVAVFFNCILFYVLHLSKAFVFDWTQVYSTFVTTIILCIYLYNSKRKSIFPLIIAHAILDTLLGAPGFYLLNIFFL